MNAQAKHLLTPSHSYSLPPHGQEVIAAEPLEQTKFLGNALPPDLDELSEAIQFDKKRNYFRQHLQSGPPYRR
jgi:hypothetical protein